jgi:hypothetical protein
MMAAPRYVLAAVGTLVLVGLVSCLATEWIGTGDLLEAFHATLRAALLVLVVAAGLLLVTVAALGAVQLRAGGRDQFLRLEHTPGAVWIVKVARTRRSGAEKVLERHDITRTASLSHVNGDAFDVEECAQLHDREPEIRMGLFGEISTVQDAELAARVEHEELVGQFGRDLAAFLRSRPLVRCEYSLDEDRLWRVLPGHEIKPVEPGITFEGGAHRAAAPRAGSR